MADQHQLELLRNGVKQWNAWRESNLVSIDLRGADLKEVHLRKADLKKARLSGANLSGANLSGANLSKADLHRANLSEANLSEADLHGADLSGANLSGANLSGANLSGANLRWTDLHETDLSEAYLHGADLQGADFLKTHLHNTDLSRSLLKATIFANTDLSIVQGLDSVVHRGPSTIGIDTLYRSQGKIPEAFLHGCGVPEPQIEYLPDLIAAMQPIQYYSCFISYSHQDEPFAQRLHERMRAANLRVWYAPEDIRSGEKMHEQFDQAIQIHDRLLIILSEVSIHSNWVKTEIRKAWKVEQQEKRRKLFPIRLTEMTILDAWEWYDGGKDLAQELREYFIPDFSTWKDHDAFEAAFDRLYNDLKASTKAG